MSARPVFKAVRTAHAFAGAVLSLIIVLIAFTGSLLVFKDDYIRAVIPEARAEADLSIAALTDVTQRLEDRLGTDRLRALVYATPDFGLHKAYLTERRFVYIDSEGEILGEWGVEERFEDWLFDLHHRLLAGNTGVWIAGLSGLAACVLVITGLIAVWPMRRGLRRGVKITAPSRGQLLSVHRNLGVWISLPIFVLMLSGVALSFPDTSRALLDRLGGPAAEPPAAVGEGDLDWAVALQESAETFPDAILRVAIWPRSPGGPVVLRLRQPDEWHPNGRSVVTVNPATSKAVGHFDATRAGTGREAYNALYPIHASHIGGRIYDIIVFMTGLALTALGVFGFWAFVRRVR